MYFIEKCKKYVNVLLSMEEWDDLIYITMGVTHDVYNIISLRYCDCSYITTI